MIAALVAGNRTEFCPAGGALREQSPGDLARRAADFDGAESAALVIAACAVASVPGELALARELAGRERRAVQICGLDAPGLEALAVAASQVADGPVLVVGSDSASLAPYWTLGARWGPAEGSVVAADPLAAVLLRAGRRAGELPGEREEQDAWAVRRGSDPQRLAALKPLFDENGSATAGTTALPGDGAAAALLMPPERAVAGSLAILAVAADARAAVERGGAAELVAAEVQESTAAEALSLSRELGLAAESVNVAGGALRAGYPIAADGVAMALRLRDRLRELGGGAGLLAGPGIAIACRLT